MNELRPSAELQAAFDPRAFREAGHRLVDQLSDYLDRARTGQGMPVLPFVDPEAMLGRVDVQFPAEPTADLVDTLKEVVESSNHLHHPHYVGHQVATVLPQAALCEMTTALLNNGMAVYEMGQVHTMMERRVVEFLAGKAGFAAADGVLTNGGSIGNLTALLAARQAKADHDVWNEGQRDRYAVLVSDQAHYCIARAVQTMGWGDGGVVPVTTDDSFRMTKQTLGEALESATSSGRRVIAVVASSCTTATGSFDPLQEVADFCEDEDLWLHVDGAHGASLLMSEEHRHLLDGIEHADSVVWDLHKMMMLPALNTAVLFADGRRSYEAFAQEASYLFEDVDPTAEWFNIGRRTMECTKRGLGVSAYSTLRAHGTSVFAEAVDLLVGRTKDLADILTGHDDFEIATRPEANILCFRHLPADAVDLDQHQDRIRRQMLRDGSFYIVQTRIRGRLWLRTTIMNPFTTREHLGELVDKIRELSM